MQHPEPPPSPTPLRAANRLASFGHALRGIALLVASQTNARIHLGVTFVVVAAGFWLQVAARDWALLALAMGLVWAAEALNTAIETVVNMASPGWHALARDAKDLAAAGVLLATLAAVVTGLCVFGPALQARLG